MEHTHGYIKLYGFKRELFDANGRCIAIYINSFLSTDKAAIVARVNQLKQDEAGQGFTYSIMTYFIDEEA